MLYVVYAVDDVIRYVSRLDITAVFIELLYITIVIPIDRKSQITTRTRREIPRGDRDFSLNKGRVCEVTRSMHSFLFLSDAPDARALRTDSGAALR